VRLLIIDECLPPRISAALRKRGRRSKSVRAVTGNGLKDVPLLRALCHLLDDEVWTLVTGDDRMPWDHSDVIEELGVTVATLLPYRKARTVLASPVEYQFEIVHRWAHHMSELEDGTIRRYKLRQHEVWRPRFRY
jgi:hypothetical protein